MFDFTIDPTITLGALIVAATNLIGLVMGVVSLAIRFERRFQHLDKCLHERAAEVRRELLELHNDNATKLAVIETRVLDMWRWFITGRGGEG